MFKNFELILFFLTCQNFHHIVNGAEAAVSQPEQIHLSLGPTQNAMTVTWATPFPLTDSTFVVFGNEYLNLDSNVTGSSHSWTYNKIERYTHRATLLNLIPDSTYYYKVGSPTQGWSHIFNFHTFPEGNDFPLRICIFGDLGFYNGTSLPAIQNAVQKQEIDIIIHVGDIGYDLHSEDGERGDRFMRQIESIAAYVPYMVIAGNHEDDEANFTNYANRFTMPNSPFGDNQVYSVDIGSVHFLALSSEYAGYYYKYGMDLIYRQEEWMERDLKIRKGYQDFPGLEEKLVDYGVDFGFWGHEHSYERLWPVSDRKVYNKVAKPYENAAAPIYIISGSAGCYSVSDAIKQIETNFKGHAWFSNETIAASAKQINDYGYTMVSVYNHTDIKLEQFSLENSLGTPTVVDTIWVRKSPGHVHSREFAATQPFSKFPDDASNSCAEGEKNSRSVKCRPKDFEKQLEYIKNNPLP